MAEYSKVAVLQALRSRIHGVERVECATVLALPRLHISSSFPEFDGVLPNGGFPLGSFVEVLCEEGSGGFSLCLKLAREALARRSAYAVVDSNRSFYPQAVAQCGLNLDSLILIRTEIRRTEWAFIQLLRSSGIGASFLSSRSMDKMAFRRFQLAAEHGGGLGFVIRPVEALKQPCWASLRLKVKRVGFGEDCRIRVELLHVRNGHMDNPICVDLDA